MAKAKDTAENAAAEEAAATEPMFEPRRATANVKAIGYTASDGSQKSIEADDDGVFWPKSAEEVAVLDSFGLVRARKAAEQLGSAATEAAQAGDKAADDSAGKE